MLAITTGCREGEITALEWKHINLRDEAYVNTHGAVDGLNQENYDNTQKNIDFEETDI